LAGDLQLLGDLPAQRCAPRVVARCAVVVAGVGEDLPGGSDPGVVVEGGGVVGIRNGVVEDLIRARTKYLADVPGCSAGAGDSSGSGFRGPGGPTASLEGSFRNEATTNMSLVENVYDP
jgi:hypothetical protein